MADLVRVQMPFPRRTLSDLTAIAAKDGFKKSPLIARLVREH
ncbi:MAG: hypothetical protein OXC31_06850 [Spirochaetaceae bacterium]|nr:hypothetical protein [Spirochaetaceae bacterium]